MGFQTGRTIEELGMTQTILDMLDKRIMLISHPSGDGLSDGADIVDDGTVVSIPNISSEYPGGNATLLVPMENVRKGILSGHSVFLTDTDGEELQISFLSDETVDLEKAARNLPLGLDEAIEAASKNDDLSVWEVEVRLYDLYKDPHNAFDHRIVAVAAEVELEARDKAEQYASKVLPTRDPVHISGLNTPIKKRS